VIIQIVLTVKYIQILLLLHS